MELPYKIVYRYFLLFNQLPIEDRIRKSAYGNMYYGQGLCEFINAATGSCYNYEELTTRDPWINLWAGNE